MRGRDYTAVIPTTGARISALSRALDSVFAQTEAATEVVLVLDCPKDSRDERLKRLHSSATGRVTILVNEGPRGPGSSRMLGVRHSRTTFVALLDDDDEWHAEKLKLQLNELERLGRHEDREFVLLTRCAIRGEGGVYHLPRRLPRVGESAARYLYSAPNLLFPSAYVATPSMLCSRALLIAEPFRLDLSHMEDIEWLIRVTQARAEMRFVDRVLTFVEGRQAIERGSQAWLATQSTSSFDFAGQVLAPIDPLLARNYQLTFGLMARSDGERWGGVRSIFKIVRQGRVSLVALTTGALRLATPSLPRNLLRQLHGARGRLSRGL